MARGSHAPLSKVFHQASGIRDPREEEEPTIKGLVIMQLSSPASARIATKRNPSLPSLGEYLDFIASELHLKPHQWQHELNDVSMQLSPRTNRFPQQSVLKLHAQHVGCMVGRQSGKTAWSVQRIVGQALMNVFPEVADTVGLESIKPQHIIYTAQKRIVAVDKWKEHCDVIINSPLGKFIEHVAGSTGHETLTFTNGSTYRPITPNRNAARGMTIDLVIVDEALAHPLWLLSTLRPTMAQRHSADGCIGSQFVVISNAGTDDSELLNHLQELGQMAVMNGDDSRVWLEWSMAPGDDPLAQSTWSRCMPTFEQPNGISLEFIQEEASSMRLSDFMREYLCYRIHESEDAIIDYQRWQDLYRIDVANSGEPVLAIDVSWDRSRSSIVCASFVDPYIAVEVIEARQGVEWLVDRTEGICERFRCPVVIDIGGPAATMAMMLEDRGIEVIPFAMKDVANAAASFYDNVRAGRISHLDDYRLNDAVKGATRRNIGERWGFNRKGNVDISPLVAASFAVWAIDAGMVGAPNLYT